MRRHWPSAALAFVAVLAAFLFPLTTALPATVALTARMAAAVVATLVILAIARSGPDGRTAVAIAALCGIAGVGLLLAHVGAQSRCMADYEGRDVIVGSVYTPEGEEYVKENPLQSASDLLFDAGGVAERVWTPDSIRSCTRLVTWTGPGAIPFLAAAGALLIRRQRYVLPARSVTTGTPVPVQPAAPLYDAFLSYRHVEPDRTIGFELVESLEAEGLRVAVDARDFSPNEHFLSEMERCIKQSRFVLCVITSHYVESDHTSEEAIISKTLDLAERRRRLVPLIYERIELPVWLHGLVGIDFTKAATVDPHERLVQLLKRRS